VPSSAARPVAEPRPVAWKPLPRGSPFLLASAGSRLADVRAALPPPAVPRRAGRGPPGSGFVQRFSRMASGIVLHTNSGVHIGLALDRPLVERGGQASTMLHAAAMLVAAARLRALPSLTASCTRQPRSGKLRIEMEEDAEAEARSLATLAVEQPALFRAVTGADHGKLPDLSEGCASARIAL
jgi:hypothetical protein